MTNRQTLETQRIPLRLRMSRQVGRGRLDGGWWPQSRDLNIEFADLVDHFPPALGRIMRAVYSPPDWDTAARGVAVAGRYVKVGSFPRDDTHLMRLTTSDGTVLTLLVVPPVMPPEQGEAALRVAASAGNTHDAAAVLSAVAAGPTGDPKGHWSDDGGSWRPGSEGPLPLPAGR